MLENVPSQVFDTYGFSMENNDDVKFLKNRYKEKSRADILLLSRTVFEMKRDGDALWAISFKLGLNIQTCKSILDGSIMERIDEAQANHITMRTLEKEYGDKVAYLVKNDKYPFDNVRKGKTITKKKVCYNESDIVVAKFFNDAHVALSDVNEYNALDKREKVRVRYRVQSGGISTIGKTNPIPKEKYTELMEVIANADKVSAAGRPIENKG